MNQKTYSFLAAATLMLSTYAHAGHVWGDWIASGTACNKFNVSVLENGPNLAVLFDQLAVNMPAGELADGLQARKTCTFRIQLTPPSGFYLAGFKQVYSGGVLKSRGSSSQLNIRYNIGTLQGRPLSIAYYQGESIRPEDDASLFTETYNTNLLVANCGGSTVYGLNMVLSASRPTTREHLIMGLDSVEAEMTPRVVLIPEYRLCR